MGLDAVELWGSQPKDRPMANQVIVKPAFSPFGGGSRLSVQWKTPNGEFFYGFRDSVREAYFLAKWVARYYSKIRAHDSVPGPAFNSEQLFTYTPEMIWEL
jgi:hypothetical protein